MNGKFIVKLIGLILIAPSFLMCNQPSATHKNTALVDTLNVRTPQDALAKLVAGNDRYINEKSIHPRTGMDRVTETAPHQAPFAAVVGCSDSRVPVEILFDQGIGDIFVIRTAGNNVNSEMVMGSVDYAIEHLGVKVLLVLGHGSCGGVTGAISEGEEEHGNIGSLLSTIRDDVSQYVGKVDSLDAAIHHHAHMQVERIIAYPHVSEKIEKGELLVKQAYYDVNTGKVTIY